MAKKRRAPIEQLRAAGRMAKQMLVDRGILAKKSVLDELMRTEGAPTLPGIPAYLPHQWTLKASQRILYDLLIIWKDECKEDAARAENITEFFKFVITELRQQEANYNKEVVDMPKLMKTMKNVPVLKDVFSPLRKKESMHAIHRFFVDSFAVAIALKNNHTTSEYANWFLTWTQDMYALWVSPEERKKIARV